MVMMLRRIFPSCSLNLEDFFEAITIRNMRWKKLCNSVQIFWWWRVMVKDDDDEEGEGEEEELLLLRIFVIDEH